MLDRVLNAEQFIDSRYDFPESGQWAELEAGKVSLFQPPDLDHGNTVLNLSKVLAEYIQESKLGYACFDLGMLMEESPDTLRFPAACYYLTGPRFAETDKAYTRTIPEIVIELASTSDRRQRSSDRVEDFLAWGAQGVWVIDPQAEEVIIASRSFPMQRVTKGESVVFPGLLPDFSCPVERLFEDPIWWNQSADSSEEE